MRRRELLQRTGAGLTVAGAVGLAGCSGDGSSDDSNDGADDDGADDGADDETETTGTQTPEDSSSPAGSVGENAVSGLEIVDWTAEPVEDEFKVTVTVENAGDQDTDAFDYNYDLTLYDSEDTEITGDAGATGSTGITEISPGEQASVNVYYGVDGTPEDVARYEMSLNCDGPFSDGSYC